ncbi:hypothetical protein IKO50_01195 [bacterium]|jgi:hypothetical protein|nr:hypothetical protein [bacterium]
MNVFDVVQFRLNVFSDSVNTAQLLAGDVMFNVFGFEMVNVLLPPFDA